MQLLRRYLESMAGTAAAEVIYRQLNSSLDQLKILREDYDDSMVDLSTSEVNQLRDYFTDLAIVY